MPVSDGLSMEYLTNLKNISNAFAPVDTNVMTQLTSADGALTNSLGFGGSTGVDLAGLTPEQVTGVINNRSTLLNQNLGAIKGITELRDMVTGGKENRDALRQASRDIYSKRSADSLEDKRMLHETNLVEQHLQANKTLAEFNNQLPVSKEKQAEFANAIKTTQMHISAQMTDAARRDATTLKSMQMQIDAGRFDGSKTATLQDLKDRTAARGVLATYLSKKGPGQEDATLAAGIANQYPDLTDGYTYVLHNGWFTDKLEPKPMPTIPIKLKDGRIVQAIQRGDGSYYMPTWANQKK